MYNADLPESLYPLDAAGIGCVQCLIVRRTVRCNVNVATNVNLK